MGTKGTPRKKQRDSKRAGEAREFAAEQVPQEPKAGPLVAQTETQKRYIAAIKSFMLTFGLGPAGVGKTYIVGSMAARDLMEGRVKQIVITRPAVDAGESLGFLPGEMDEKYMPYIAPFLDVLNERLGRSQTEMFLKNGRITAAPLAYMRGRTFKDSFVVMDEAQNATVSQMKLFLTRIGIGSRVVVNGDESQVDIKGMSGLTDAVQRVQHIPSVKIIRFGRGDIVRSGLVAEIVQAYEDPIPV